MAITERKLRKVGNSTVVTLSKDFLDSMGMSESDTVIIDEEKLKEAMVKKVEKDEDQLLVEMSMAKMSKQYEETFKALVTK
ncbi:addiction module antitoxin [Enterococcus sp. MJM12]|uniref:Addiction module antitoxin n=1 Tax=Candidatus Enterococcus myersii TaxID=2815322 RepID=A0ABS3H823_9ENTE|nr:MULTISPECIES: addiction module antitoxin [Enterococcus]MBO0448773.1 addiction module antitoxin [Enterococcus sp. MJM12]MCD1024479.1 addiction module antitoxin [Enterococcus sp. SMC-9]MDT2739965.1 addiction module antitoxin [Enterococcus canintestini]